MGKKANAYGNDKNAVASDCCTWIYRVLLTYWRVKKHIFTNTEQKYIILLSFERGIFAVS
jgi:hypothetical protein